MPDCSSIDPLITPYVDGQLADGERDVVEQHLRKCPPCHSRASAEMAIQHLLTRHKTALHVECAPDALRARCGSLSRSEGSVAPQTAPVFSWRTRLAPLALAATLVLIVG